MERQLQLVNVACGPTSVWSIADVDDSTATAATAHVQRRGSARQPHYDFYRISLPVPMGIIHATVEQPSSSAIDIAFGVSKIHIQGLGAALTKGAPAWSSNELTFHHHD